MNIGAQEFDYLRNLLRDHAAIVMEQGKEYLAETRLAPLSAAEGFNSVQHLLQTLRVQPFSGLHRRVLESMTNNETWFFRDVEPFHALKTVVIPELLQKRATEHALHFWSGASSSGQEAYSIAMQVREFFNLPSWNFSIMGTDISNAILERARSGRYSQIEVNRGMPTPLLLKHFNKDGLDWELKPEVRQMVTFRWLNLAEAWPDLPRTDVMFLRNVLIYFDVPTRREILARVRRVLRPDGYLFLGGAETTLNIDDSFERVQFQKTAYYRLRV
jgi:chemotaxis protein methyltransferase CheR